MRSELRIDKSYLTLAGQTAPGDGITLRDQTVSLGGCHDVIIRYLRVRLGDKRKPDKPEKGEKQEAAAEAEVEQ